MYSEIMELFPEFNTDDAELKRQTEIIERVKWKSGHKVSLKWRIKWRIQAWLA